MAFLDVFRKKYHPKYKSELKELVNNEKIKLSQIDVSNMTDFEEVFRDCKRTDFSGIEKWNVSNVTNFRNCFRNCKGFNADISGWNTSNAKTMSCMFAGCENFDCDISKWDVSKIQGRYKASYIANMFKGCDKFSKRVNNIYIQAEAKGVAKEEIFNLMPFPRPKDHKVVIIPKYEKDLNEIAERTEDLSTIDTSAVKNFNNFLKNSTRKTFTGIEKMSMESALYCKNFLSGAKNFAQKFAITRKSKELRDAEKELKKVTKEYNKTFGLCHKAYKIIEKKYGKENAKEFHEALFRYYTLLNRKNHIDVLKSSKDELKALEHNTLGKGDLLTHLDYFDSVRSYDSIKKLEKDLPQLFKDPYRKNEEHRHQLFDLKSNLEKKIYSLKEKDEQAITQGKVVTEEEAKGKELPKETVVEKAELPKVTNIDSMCKGTQVNHAVPVAPNVITARNAYAENDKFLADLSGLKDAPIKYCQGAFDKVDPAHLAKEFKNFDSNLLNASFCRKVANEYNNTEVSREYLFGKEDIDNYKVILFEDREQFNAYSNKLKELGILKDPIKHLCQFADGDGIHTYADDKHLVAPPIVVSPKLYEELKKVPIQSKYLSNYAEHPKEFKLEDATVTLSVNQFYSSPIHHGNRNIYSLVDPSQNCGLNLFTYKELQSNNLNPEAFKQKQVDIISNLSKRDYFDKMVKFVKEHNLTANMLISDFNRNKDKGYLTGYSYQNDFDAMFVDNYTKNGKYPSYEETSKKLQDQIKLDLVTLTKAIENYQISDKSLNENSRQMFQNLSSEKYDIFDHRDYCKDLLTSNYGSFKNKIASKERICDCLLKGNFEGIGKNQEKSVKQEPIKHEEKRVSKSSMRR